MERYTIITAEIFTVENFLHLVSIRRPFYYATSFFGVADLLTIIPTCLSLLSALPADPHPAKRPNLR